MFDIDFMARLWDYVGMKVRGAIKAIEAAGWCLHTTRGSHRQYRHATIPGRVTIAGRPSDDLHPKTWGSIKAQARIDDTEGE